MKSRLLMLVTGMAFLSAAAEAATPRAYWAESQAEKAVLKQVRLGDCVVRPSAGCKRTLLWRVRTADCVGEDELGTSFRYARFRCSFVVTDYYGRPLARGRIGVYPQTATTMRWRLL